MLLGPTSELPNDWQLVDNAFIETIATELKVLAIAASNGATAFEDDEPETLKLTEADVTRMVMTLHRRAEAAAELLTRIRNARIDHPSFGGRPEDDAGVEALHWKIRAVAAEQGLSAVEAAKRVVSEEDDTKAQTEEPTP